MADSTHSTEWRAVIGIPGYEVSREGQVRSVDRQISYPANKRIPSPFTANVRGRTLTPRVKINKGKPQALLVAIRQGPGKRIVRYVHRLVLEAFVGPAPAGHECCHNNGDFRDNRLENLRWDTRKANVADAKKHGTHKCVSQFAHLRDRSKAEYRRGEDHHAVKLTAAKVAEIRNRWPAESARVLAKEFGVCKSSIKNIGKRLSWSHI